jgi:hypothetical protein
MKNQSNQLTLFAGDSLVRMCQLPDSGKAWMESEADFGLSSYELLKALNQDGLLLKTSPVFYPATEAEILPSSFAGWSNAGMACAGGYLTLNLTEWHSAAVVCSLSQVLETEVAPKFYLSARACRGILRRVEKRGKALPERLKVALESVAIQTQATETEAA